MSLRDAS